MDLIKMNKRIKAYLKSNKNLFSKQNTNFEMTFKMQCCQMYLLLHQNY